MALKGEGRFVDLDVGTLMRLRKILIQSEVRVKVRRAGPDGTELRKRLDEALLVYRVARKTGLDRKTKADTKSWLRAVRQAAGIPVEEVARRLGVIKWEVFRLEKAERSSRIGMATLRRAAAALGCELVYALVPKEGSLEDLANEQRKVREEACEVARVEKERTKKKVEGLIGWLPAVRRQIRREFRKLGLRVR